MNSSASYSYDCYHRKEYLGYSFFSPYQIKVIKAKAIPQMAQAEKLFIVAIYGEISTKD